MKCKPITRQPLIDKNEDFSRCGESFRLDAIFVPTCRAASTFLRQVELLASLAEAIYVLPTGLALDSFQSKRTFPRNVRVLSSEAITEIHRNFLCRSSSHNPSRIAGAHYDLPTKRNLALHLARLSGLRRICLLDDDITITTNQVKAATAALSQDSPISGFYVFDFPDVSTIDHIHRMVTSSPSETLPGGNCLFMLVDSVEGFFPYIYNEDWIFVLHNLTRRSGSVIGEVKQEAHSPWLDDNRVRFEEFGEAVITGLLPLHDVIHSAESLSADYWAHICLERRQWLVDLYAACTDVKLRQTIHLATKALALFVPHDFVQFMQAVKSELNDYLWLRNIPKLL